MSFSGSTALRALTPAVNVTVPRREYQARKALQRGAHELLEQVGLRRSGSFDCPAGDQQRVAIARPIIIDPPLLLADNVPGNLDFATSETIFDLLIELNARTGATLLVATHDPWTLDALCTWRSATEDGAPTATAARDNFARPETL